VVFKSVFAAGIGRSQAGCAYSITVVARSRSSSGWSGPMPWPSQVDRRSNVVGCSTGRSPASRLQDLVDIAGRAPKQAGQVRSVRMRPPRSTYSLQTKIVADVAPSRARRSAFDERSFVVFQPSSGRRALSGRRRLAGDRRASPLDELILYPQHRIELVIHGTVFDALAPSESRCGSRGDRLLEELDQFHIEVRALG